MEIYAKGKAGRYLIRTVATLYGTVFAQMTETASMYFFIEAKFLKMRKSVSELSDSYVSNYGRITFNEVSPSTPPPLPPPWIMDGGIALFFAETKD